MMFFESLVILAIILIIIRSIISAIRDQRLIELNAQLLVQKRQQKQPTQKRFEFIEDETEEDTAFGVPIDMLEEDET